jgi:hypothetical protein
MTQCVRSQEHRGAARVVRQGRLPAVATTAHDDTSWHDPCTLLGDTRSLASLLAAHSQSRSSRSRHHCLGAGCALVALAMCGAASGHALKPLKPPSSSTTRCSPSDASPAAASRARASSKLPCCEQERQRNACVGRTHAGVEVPDRAPLRSAPVGGVRAALHGGAAGDDDGLVLPQLGHNLCAAAWSASQSQETRRICVTQSQHRGPHACAAASAPPRARALSTAPPGPSSTSHTPCVGTLRAPAILPPAKSCAQPLHVSPSVSERRHLQRRQARARARARASSRASTTMMEPSCPSGLARTTRQARRAQLLPGAAVAAGGSGRWQRRRAQRARAHPERRSASCAAFRRSSAHCTGSPAGGSDRRFGSAMATPTAGSACVRQRCAEAVRVWLGRGAAARQ